MGREAPRVPLVLSQKAAESIPSHAARQHKAKTAKIKIEKQEVAMSAILSSQKLRGDPPPCEIPSSFAIDHEEQTLFFNTYNERDQSSEIFSCDLKKKTWKNITKAIRHLPHPIGTPERAQQLPPRYGGTMAYYKMKPSGQRLLLLFGGQVNGLDPDGHGEVSNEMIAIDVDNLRWWVIGIAGGPVVPRVEAHLIIVNDQLFVFGGKERVDEQLETTESYSVASFTNNSWIWDVRDEPYPSHVPALGSSCDAVTIQDGDTQKILLTVGCTDSTKTV
ncbi:hypothetical protein MSAN_00935700 [Mycena sanguinolenta]|uniref:Kelch repeat-containing protein n=1 Tax=Mycena sanguinolenta TaxID=230812 RepID=A0A8H7D926_9AGAR|nr:hypothetical protein MSAN_00935700 [Mycena sanguinolenta]